MLNLKHYTFEEVTQMLQKRNKTMDIKKIFTLFQENQGLQTQIEALRSKANIAAKNQDHELGITIKTQLKAIETSQDNILQELNPLLAMLPNMMDDSVPIGIDENDNVCIKISGSIVFSKHHYDMDIFQDCIDFTGSRFVVLKQKFSKLERAIGNFMIDFLTNNGFSEFSVPYIMNSYGLTGSGHLPKDADVMFKIENEDKYLIPTAEPALVNLGRDQRWNDTKYFCALTDCFRKEAGAGGRDLKGLIRLHQFKKCEMVCFTQSAQSYDILEKMLGYSCEILNQLKIPWRILLLCSGDMPATSAKTYDIEVPIGGKWREIASISNCTDFQANNINCKNTNKEFLHILNGSALAVGRTLATLLEVHYNPQTNSITIPKCLIPYTGFEYIQL